MACVAGRLSRAEISVDNGVTYKNLGGLVDATLNFNIDELECTTHDSNGVREYIPNHQDATADFTMRWDETDPGQVDLLNSIFPSPTSIKIRFYLEAVSGRTRFEADAFATSWAPSGPLDDKIGRAHV